MVAKKEKGAKLETKVLEAIRSSDLPEPVREYKFHDTRRWRFDFAYPNYKVAIEVDGGVYSRGRHTTGKGYTSDQYKGNAAIEDGWVVLHYTTTMISSKEKLEEMVNQIRVVLESRGYNKCET